MTVKYASVDRAYSLVYTTVLPPNIMFQTFTRQAPRSAMLSLSDRGSSENAMDLRPHSKDSQHRIPESPKPYRTYRVLRLRPLSLEVLSDPHWLWALCRCAAFPGWPARHVSPAHPRASRVRAPRRWRERPNTRACRRPLRTKQKHLCTSRRIIFCTALRRAPPFADMLTDA